MRKRILVIVLIVINLSSCSSSETPDPSSAGQPGAGSSRLAELLGDTAQGYPKADQPRVFRFPEDHGPHNEYRNEWWYLTGNLDGEGGERFGFELTLFRFLLQPGAVADESAWRSNEVYIGHFAITDVAAREFHVSQRYSRSALGLAGAQAEPFRVWLEDWELAELPAAADATDAAGGSAASAATAGTRWHLRAADPEIGLDLELRPEKAPVLNGVGGLSRKSDVPGNASYYYSLPRLRTDGTLRSGGRTYRVSGLSWLDREWGSSGLSGSQAGWDWFALQLSDGSDLMFYELRALGGGRDPHSAGTFVSASGEATYLSVEDVAIEVLDEWQSPLGGAYPMRWRLRVPRLGLALELTPVMNQQELVATVRYWEGAVDATGQSGGAEVRGRGYVELTGYAGAATGLREE